MYECSRYGGIIWFSHYCYVCVPKKMFYAVRGISSIYNIDILVQPPPLPSPLPLPLPPGGNNDNDNDFISNIHTYLQIIYLQVSYLQYHCCVILGDQYSINAVFLLTPANRNYQYASAFARQFPPPLFRAGSIFLIPIFIRF